MVWSLGFGVQSLGFRGNKMEGEMEHAAEAGSCLRVERE